MKVLGLIIQREYISKVKRRAFIFTTLFTPLFLALVIFLPSAIINKKGNNTIRTIYVLDDTGKYTSKLANTDKYSFYTLGEIVENETMDAYLQISYKESDNPLQVELYTNLNAPNDLVMYINQTINDMQTKEDITYWASTHNLDHDEHYELMNIINNPYIIKTNVLKWDNDNSPQNPDEEVLKAISIFLAFFMFFFITIYGNMVIQSIVEEKTNRIVEVIISSVKPFYLMMGKIIGVGLTGLTQIAIWMVFGVLFGIFSNSFQTDLSQPSVVLAQLSGINWWATGIYFAIFFTGGYLLFASLFTMFGSAANDAQEAQQLTIPAKLILFLTFYIGMSTLENPDSILSQWCSFIPFTSPVVMLVRTSFDVPIWQIFISVILLYISAILLTMLSSKIYRIGILMHGKKIKIFEVFKWIGYK